MNLGRAVVALRDVAVHAPDGARLLHVPDLALHPGERVVVTGPSGAGKSLPLGVLGGLRVRGLTVSGRRRAAGTTCAVVPQRGQDALHPLVPLARQLRQVSGADPQRVADVLDALGLGDPDLQARRPVGLSGGQDQRGAIALAVLGSAPLVVADELTSALDHRTRDDLLALLGPLLGDDRTLVVATHDQRVVASVLDAAGPGGAHRTRHLQVRSGTVEEEPR